MIRSWILPEVLAVVIATTSLLLGLLYYAGLEPAELRERLMSLSVATLSLNAFLLLLSGTSLLLLYRRTLRRLLFKRPSYYLAAVFLLAVVLSFISPKRSIIFWDEHIYMGIAQSISLTGKAVSCIECNAEYGEFKVFQSEYNKQPNGYPFFLAIVFALFGVSESSAYFANFLAYLLGVIAVGSAARLLFSSRIVAYCSSGFFAATPMVVRWAGAASAEVLSAAMCSASLAAVVLFCRKASLTRGVFAAAITLWAVMVRPENLLMLIPLGLYLVVVKRRMLLNRAIVITVSLFASLLTTELLHLYAVRGERWGSAGEKFSLAQFWFNLPVNGPFFLVNERYPVMFTALAIVGLLFSLRKGAVIPGGRETKGGLVSQGSLAVMTLFLWFLWSWGVYLFFYAGSYDFGVDARFSVNCAPPLAIFAGLGLSRLLPSVPQAGVTKPFQLSIVVLLFLNLGSFLPFMRAETHDAADARADANLTKELQQLLPRDSIVLSHTPHLWNIRGYNSAQTMVIRAQPGNVEGNMMKRYRGGVYFHYGFWCNVPDARQNAICNSVFENFTTELIGERRDRGFRFALYRLSIKEH